MDPVEVHSLNDIKRIVAEFEPKRNARQIEIPLNTFLEEVENGKKITYKVSAKTRSKSKREILIDGLNLIKERNKISKELHVAGEPIEIDGRIMRPAVLNSSTDGHSWVDPLIKQWTGGVRLGTLITWNLGDGYEYRYEIFTHSLTRVPRVE